MVKDCSKFKSSSNVIAVSVSEKINEQISASNKKIVTFIKMVVGVCVCVRGGGGGGGGVMPPISSQFLCP